MLGTEEGITSQELDVMEQLAPFKLLKDIN